MKPFEFVVLTQGNVCHPESRRRDRYHGRSADLAIAIYPADQAILPFAIVRSFGALRQPQDDTRP